MRQNLINKILIIVFLLMLFSPILLSLFTSQELLSYSENRIKSSFPVYNVEAVLKAESVKAKLIASYREGSLFRSSLETYFRENFPLRDWYLLLYSNYKFELLNTSPYSGKVVLGDDGWMFVGNYFGDCILESYGLKQLSESELDAICNNLLEITNWAHKEGISFYLVIAPEKQTVYPQFLPLTKSSQSIADQLKERLEHTGINVIDLKEGFTDCQPFRLYHKTDSHWNGLGAFCGTQQLLSRIRSDFPTITSLELEDYTVDTIPGYNMDLSRMLSLPMKEMKITVTVKRRVSKKKNKQLTVPEGFQYASETYESRFENSKASEKIIYFHDSFAEAMMPFIGAKFKESLFIRDYNVDRDVILKENPDIVVLQVVERNLDVLVKK